MDRGDGTSDVGKTYIYKVTEVDGSDSSTTGGMTYDSAVYYVKVVNTREADGSLTSTATYYDEQGNQLTSGRIPFTNTYEVTSTTATITGHKTTDGFTLGAGETFEFQLVGANEATRTAMTDGTITGLATSARVTAGNLDFNFGTATFTKAGTYTFNVKETVPATDSDGMTYDRHTAQVTVTVSDLDGAGKHTGALAATVTYSNAGATVGATDASNTQTAAFTNRYRANGTFSGIEVTKALSGHYLAEGQFSFTITGVDSATATAAEAEAKLRAGDRSFWNGASSDGETATMSGKIAFNLTQADLGKTYTYTVHEVDSGAPGYTYDAQDVTVAIEVRANPNSQAQLYTVTTVTKNGASQTYDSRTDGAPVASFSNSYAASLDYDANAGFTIAKTYTADVSGVTVEDEFTFTVTPKDTVSTPVGGSDDGAGTVVTPAANAAAKLGISENGKTVTLKVQTGSTATAAVSAIMGNDVTFTQEDAGVTYTYEVAETKGTEDGVTYDTTVYTVTIAIEDNGDGTLTATTTARAEGKNAIQTSVTSGGTAAVATLPFTNTYAVSTVDFDTVGGLQIVKTMTGRSIGSGEFEFTMTAANDASATKLGAQRKTVSTSGAVLAGNTATETVGVTTGLVFTESDLGKTYTYTVAEDGGGTTKDGVTYDNTTYTVAFVVTDAGDGTPKVTVRVNGGDVAEYTGVRATRAAANVVSLAFANSYSAGTVTVGSGGTVEPNASKTLTGRALVDGEFAFGVYDSAGTEVSSGANDADGAISFSTITYTTESLNTAVANGTATRSVVDGKDVYSFVYTVTEKQESLGDGVTAVKDSFTVTVKVTDDGVGGLTAQVVYPTGSEDRLVFQNAYGASASAELAVSGTKVLSVESGDNAPDIAGAYTFTITGSEGAPLPSDTSVTNDAAGNVDFGTITYTMENVFGDAVDESSASGDAAVTEGAEQAVESAAAGTTDGAGETGEAADTAEATASDATEATAAETPETAEATADPVGASATEATATSAQRTKTFTYTVTESGSVAGVTNDAQTTRTFTVTVTDNGDGTISVASDPAQGSKFTFTNTYGVEAVTSSVTDQVSITKTLAGRALVADEFSFELVEGSGADAQVVATGTNDENGAVTLSAITYTEPGEHTYTVREVAGSAEGVTYDSTGYQVRATVTDQGDGTLAVAYRVVDDAASEGIVFANVYESGDAATGGDSDSTDAGTTTGTSDADLPQTGDTALPWIILAGLAVVAVVCIVVGIGSFKVRK